ncbi:MAG UNVERIFIED_CONTAM: hypothetical protein LVR18_05125 [Planctomycetaceae bacterium]
MLLSFYFGVRWRGWWSLPARLGQPVLLTRLETPACPPGRAPPVSRRLVFRQPEFPRVQGQRRSQGPVQRAFQWLTSRRRPQASAGQRQARHNCPDRGPLAQVQDLRQACLRLKA